MYPIVSGFNILILDPSQRLHTSTCTNRLREEEKHNFHPINQVERKRKNATVGFDASKQLNPQKLCIMKISKSSAKNRTSSSLHYVCSELVFCAKIKNRDVDD